MRGLLVFVLTATLAAVAITAESLFHTNEYVETLATLTDCQHSESGIRIRYDAAGTSGVVFVPASQSAQWPSAAYREVVTAEFSIDGKCPPAGEQLRLTHCRQCEDSAAIAVERGGRAASFDEHRQTLWIVRHYIDRTQPRDAGAALFMVSRVLARYNSTDGGSRSVWIRDRLERSLFAYASRAKATDAIERYGRPSLLPGVDPLVGIFAARSKATGLVKALPYMPRDLRRPAFVGAWGQFALAVFAESGDGRLEKLYDHR